MLAHALFCGCTLLVHAGQDSTDLDRALALIPQEASAFAVVPDLDLLNDDLGALIDATNQPASVLAGRPIEMFKAAVGFGAEFDESGSMVVWLQPDPASPGESSPLVMVPTRDPARFLESNFTPDGKGWRTGDQMLVFAKECAGHVLLGTVRGMVESYAPGQGSAKRVRARLAERQLALFARADLLLWADRRFLDTMSELAAETSQGIPVRSLGFSPPREGLPPAIEQAFEASTVLVNFDPLGFSMRSFTVFDPETEFGRLLEGGDQATTPLGRLPLAPFYLAMSIDVAGLGGMSNLQRIFGLLGMDPPPGGSWFEDPDLRIDSLQGAVYPSRLGIALGGFLNDSSLVVTGPDPEALEARFRSELEAMDGERDGVRYETIWTEDKPLRTGGVSDAFQIKETVLPPSQRSKQSLGRSAIERMFMQTMFGSRGLAGFAGTEGDAFVLTFSQRPDVWNRALAAAGGGASLEEDPVLASMRSWLMSDPDVEIAVGFGSLGKLLGQLARSLPGIEPERMPQIPEGTPPVVLNFGHERGIAEMAVLVPSGVIEVGVEQFIRDYSHLRGYGRTPAPEGPISTMAESSLLDQPEWSCGPDRLGGQAIPLLMGILNVTPDSFHDGRSTFRDLEGMVALGDELRSAGADIIDVGGESTRPGASRVPPEEQCLRTTGVIAGIRERCTTPISIDTTHRSVAEAALDAGATIVNDVSAGMEDPGLLDLVAERGAGLVLMHRLTDPLRDSYSDRYESDPEYGAPGVVSAVADHLRQRFDAAVDRGVGPDQIVLDPGLGFGKSVPQNLDLVRGLPDLRASLGRPLLVGASRKSFIGALLGGQPPSERLPGSLAVALVAARLGAFVLRTHDVAPTRDTLLVAAEIDRPGTTSGGTI